MIHQRDRHISYIHTSFERVWYAGLVHRLKPYGISDQMFGLISSFVGNRWLWVVLDGKSSQEYPVNAGVPQVNILDPTLFLLYINDHPDDVIFKACVFYQIFIFHQMPFKNYEKCFLFHIKSSFHSQDIQIFVF